MELPKLHKTLNIIIRLTIVGLSLGFIYWKVFAHGRVDELVDAINSYGSDPFFYRGIGIVLLLMFVNWSIETLKWKLLVSRIEKLSFYRAFVSVLSGVTVSVFTPNRTGEYLGRAFNLKSGDPVKAVFLSILGSISQLLITIVLGTTAAIFVYREFLPAGYLPSYWVNIGVITGITLFDLTLLALFFNFPFFTRVFRSFVRSHWDKIVNYLAVIETVTGKEMIKVLALSLLRYLVFSLQFYMMLIVFGIKIPILQAMIFIPLIYLTLAVIPTIALSELGVRGSVSLSFIGFYYLQNNMAPLTEVQSMAIVLASGMLWIINLAVPAILGTPFVFKLRFFRR